MGDFDSTGKRTVDLFLGKHVKTVTVPVERTIPTRCWRRNMRRSMGPVKSFCSAEPAGAAGSHAGQLPCPGLSAKPGHSCPHAGCAYGDLSGAGGCGDLRQCRGNGLHHAFYGNAVVTLKDGGMKYPLNHLAPNRHVHGREQPPGAGKGSECLWRGAFWSFGSRKA